MSEILIKNGPQGGAATPGAKLHIVDLIAILVRHRWLVIGTTMLTGSVALIVSMLLTPMFTSSAKIMPPQQPSSAMSAVLGQLGGLAGAAGGLANMKNPNDVYVGLLESRTIGDALIARLGLHARYRKDQMDMTRLVLVDRTAVAVGKKDGFITISASDPDPQFAADLANAYVEELSKLTQSLALTEASQRRLFFEKQLNASKIQLADAEVALRKTQEKTGLIRPDGQVQAIINNLAQIKGTIAAKEVQLDAMRTFAGAGNPELLRASEELRGLKAQLAKLEQNQTSRQGDFMVPTGKIPEVGVEYVRSMRDVKYSETMFELLAKQFELAKIDEAKNAPVIQLLDKAIPAERKSKPKRLLITLGGVIAGGFLGILLAFLRNGYAASRRDPDGRLRWQQLDAAWKRVPFTRP